jgi:hypothetical protein
MNLARSTSVTKLGAIQTCQKHFKGILHGVLYWICLEIQSDYLANAED